MNIDIIDIDTVDATTVRIDGVEFAKADCSVSAYGDQHAQIVVGGQTFIVSHGSAVNGYRPRGQTALLYAIDSLLNPPSVDTSEMEALTAAAAASASAASAASATAAANANVFASTAAGLSGTSQGSQFQVLSADGSEFVRYRHDAGPVATEVASFPSADSEYLGKPLLADSGYLWAVVDSQDRIGLAIKPDGYVVGKFDRSSIAGSAYLQPTTDIWCLGDSLTTGWRDALVALLEPTRTITNGGVGGQSSVQIAARTNEPRAMSLVTLAGPIPATVTAVGVTSLTVRMISAPGYRSGSHTMKGWIGGVYGTLLAVHDASSEASDVYTFTRDEAGSEVYVHAETPFVPDVAGRDFQVLITVVGTNNIGNTEDIIRDTEYILSCQKTAEKRFLIITPSNSSPKALGEAPTIDHVGDCKEIEDALVRKYGDRVLRSRLFSHQFNDGSADDLADVAAGCFPRSLRTDNIHWGATFHGHIAAWLANEIARREW